MEQRKLDVEQIEENGETEERKISEEEAKTYI